MYNLALDYYYDRNYTRAEKFGSQVLEIQRRVLGPEDHDMLDTMGLMARIYLGEGKYAQAEPLCSEV